MPVEILNLANTEFEGGNRSYVIERDGTVALVDTGIATSTVQKRFVDELAAAGYAVDDIDLVFLTHWHYDHSGLVGFLQAESDATVYVHEADAPLVRQDPDAWLELDTLWRRRFNEWGMPQEKCNEILTKLASNRDKSGQKPQSVESITNGERIPVGSAEMEVVHTPGHTAGSSCFVLYDSEEIFVGDTVLPVYTPNVGGADVRLSQPLNRYLNSLETLLHRQFPRVWPGHRNVIETPSDRINTIIDHHRDRTDRVLDILREGEAFNAWTVSSNLFGDLEGIHILHGPGEAFAHLEHLVRAGVVHCNDHLYTLLDQDISADKLF